MSSEVEINRNRAIPSSTSLPEVVLATEEYDYGLNLISTMAATRENIVEPSTVMSILSTSMIVGNKVIDVRDSSPSSELSEEVTTTTTETQNDSVGVVVSLMDEQNNETSANHTPEGDEEILVPTTTNSVEEESFAIEDTDTDDDVILVTQPIETIELLGDDDEDGDVQLINTNEPIPKPKRLPQHQKNNQQPQASSSSSTNTISVTPPFPSIPRLSEPSSSFSFSDDEHLTPILNDLLNDHFGHLDFDLPLATNIQMPESSDVINTHTRPSYGKSPRGLFISNTNEIAIQTEVVTPQKKDMETQTDHSTFCGKRKLLYSEYECDGDECPICYEPWDESGEHSLVSLKCGHLFGESCLRKWLNDLHASQKQRLCPVCRTRVEVKHIRTLYARRVIQINYDPELKRLKQELEVSRERAKKYEILYKREKDKEKIRNGLQGNLLQPRMSVSVAGGLPPSLIRQQPQQQQQQQPSPSPLQGGPLPIRTLSQVVPHLNVPTTSRGHTSNPPPYAIYPAPLVTTRQHNITRSDPVLRMLYEDFAHDYSAIPISSANVIVDPRVMNH